MAVYIFLGGEPRIVHVRYTIILGVWGAPPGKFFDFEHPEITSGAFLDKKFSSYKFCSMKE